MTSVATAITTNKHDEGKCDKRNSGKHGDEGYDTCGDGKYAITSCKR